MDKIGFGAKVTEFYREIKPAERTVDTQFLKFIDNIGSFNTYMWLATPQFGHSDITSLEKFK